MQKQFCEFKSTEVRLRNLRFSQWWRWRLSSSGTWRRVGSEFPDVSTDCSAIFFKVKESQKCENRSTMTFETSRTTHAVALSSHFTRTLSANVRWRRWTNLYASMYNRLPTSFSLCNAVCWIYIKKWSFVYRDWGQDFDHHIVSCANTIIWCPWSVSIIDIISIWLPHLGFIEMHVFWQN
jgi:hypothetical protein